MQEDNSSKYCELFSQQVFPSPFILSLSLSVSRPAAVHNTQQLTDAKRGMITHVLARSLTNPGPTGPSEIW